MKKPTDRTTTKRRTLVVNREIIKELTELELTQVAGGWTFGLGCDVSQAKGCFGEGPI